MKAIIAATKALIAAIAAGGWIAVLVIIVICLIGMIIGSCFGIFFSGEDSGTGQTMQTAVQEINTDYQENLDEIKTSHSYDVLEMSGSRAVWKEVLAVYAVKTTTDSDNAQEVATMDDEKIELLKDIFWQMNEISSSTSTQTETVIETSDDGNGNIVETETTVTQTYLYITVSHKTAEEMADQFGFNEDSAGTDGGGFWPMRTIPFGPRCFTALPEGWRNRHGGALPGGQCWRRNRTGAGTALAAVWNGAPAL